MMYDWENHASMHNSSMFDLMAMAVEAFLILNFVNLTSSSSSLEVTVTYLQKINHSFLQQPIYAPRVRNAVTCSACLFFEYNSLFLSE